MWTSCDVMMVDCQHLTHWGLQRLTFSLTGRGAARLGAVYTPRERCATETKGMGQERDSASDGAAQRRSAGCTSSVRPHGGGGQRRSGAVETGTVEVAAGHGRERRQRGYAACGRCISGGVALYAVWYVLSMMVIAAAFKGWRDVRDRPAGWLSTSILRGCTAVGLLVPWSEGTPPGCASDDALGGPQLQYMSRALP